MYCTTHTSIVSVNHMNVSRWGRYRIDGIHVYVMYIFSRTFYQYFTLYSFPVYQFQMECVRIHLNEGYFKISAHSPFIARRLFKVLNLTCRGQFISYIFTFKWMQMINVYYRKHWIVKKSIAFALENIVWCMVAMVNRKAFKVRDDNLNFSFRFLHLTKIEKEKFYSQLNESEMEIFFFHSVLFAHESKQMAWFTMNKNRGFRAPYYVWLFKITCLHFSYIKLQITFQKLCLKTLTI